MSLWDSHWDVCWAGREPTVPSGWEGNGSQSGQGAIELGFPWPTAGEMQGEAARPATPFLMAWPAAGTPRTSSSPASQSNVSPTRARWASERFPLPPVLHRFDNSLRTFAATLRQRRMDPRRLLGQAHFVPGRQRRLRLPRMDSARLNRIRASFQRKDLAAPKSDLCWTS